MSPTRRSFFIVAWLGSTSLFAQPSGPARGCCPVTPESIAWMQFAAKARAALRTSQSAIPPLPPPGPGVTDLTFAEFFSPIGDRGPEYSDALRRLDGQRVRIAGFMVHQQVQAPGLLLLTAAPVSTHEVEYGLCDELPPATLHVLVPSRSREKIALCPGPVVLTGRLSVGPRAEADGRNSVARLVLDEPNRDEPLLLSAYALRARENL